MPDFSEITASIVKTVVKTAKRLFHRMPAEELNPLIPPTPTPTPTLTFTPTPGPSSTPTPLPTATATLTPSPTPTPAQAEVQVTGLPSLQLYQSPGGPVIGELRARQLLTVLYGRQEYGGLVWVQVQDEEGRVGWMPQIYLLSITVTPIPSATK